MSEKIEIIDERVKELLEENLKQAEKEIEEYVKANGGNDAYLRSIIRDNHLLNLYEKVNKIKKQLEFHNFWNKEEFKPIREIIESYKDEIYFIDGVDYIEYQLKKNDNMFFLGFNFKHYNGKKYNYDLLINHYDKGYDSLSGFIVYDTDGHIYLSKKSVTTENWISLVSSEIEKRPIYYQKFIDDEYMYIEKQFVDSQLFKLKDGKYELVRSFGRYATISALPALWDKKLLLIDGKKLYSVEEKKFTDVTLNGHISTCDDNDSGVYYGYDNKIYDKEMDKEQRELISKYLKDNELLLSKSPIIVDYENKRREYQTMCFMDMNGHVVSKLYVISNDTFNCISFDITDETYNEVFENVKVYLTNELKKEVNRKKAAKKAAETRKAKKQLINQKIIFETMKELCANKQEPKKMTYHLKKKEEKED